MKFAFIKSHLADYPVRTCCRLLGVSPAGYYARKGRPESAQAGRRRELAERIEQIHWENRQVYGSPRVHQVLKREGQDVSVNTVADIMRERGIKAKTRRRFFPRTTDSAHAQPVAPNLLGRRFTAELPDQKWVADMTYIPTDEGWLYLAGVLDLCSRKIVGWSMTDHMRVELVGEALRMAINVIPEASCCTTAIAACSTPRTITSIYYSRKAWW